MYYGDIRLGQTIEWTFTTRRFTTGVPFTLAGTPSLEVYETGNTTPNTAGITLTVDYSGVTGLNHVSIVASSGNSYATANDFSVVIAAGTVDSVSVVGETIGAFSIENRSALRPATVGRNLNVSAGGVADADMTAISADSTAADRLETMLDGTGGNTLSLGNLVVAAASGAAVQITGASAAAGVVITGGATSGKGVQIDGTGSGDGVEINGGTTGIGVDINGGSSSGRGVTIDATSGIAMSVVSANDAGATFSGFPGMRVQAPSGNNTAFEITGAGSGPAVAATGGATGHGLLIQGGATSGDGVRISATDGDGLEVIGAGAGNVDIRADITGNLSGSVGSVTGDIGGLSAGAVTDVQDAVWDAPIADHLDAGSTGEALDDAGGAGTPPTVGEIADAVWDEATAGHTTSGTFGEQAKTDIDAILADTDVIGTPSNLGGGATVAANLSDIEGQTDDIGAAGAGLTALATAAELAKVPKSDSNVTWNATAAAQLQTEAADALNAYDPPTRAELTTDTNSILTAVDAVPTNAELTAALAAADDAVLAAIAALNNLSSAQVLTQVNAALDTALTDSVPADGALPTLRQASYMIGQFLFERDVSGTTLTVKKVNGSTTLMTFTLNDASAPTSITRTT